MLKHDYLVAKFGFDTAKNEPRQVLQFLAEKLELNTVVDDRIRQLSVRDSTAADCSAESQLSRGCQLPPNICVEIKYEVKQKTNTLFVDVPAPAR